MMNALHYDEIGLAKALVRNEARLLDARQRLEGLKAQQEKLEKEIEQIEKLRDETRTRLRHKMTAN